MILSWALAWMVSALVCSGQLKHRLGTLCAESSDQSAKRGAALATIIINALWSSGSILPLVLASLVDGRSAPPVPGNGHDGVMDRLLHDSPVRGLPMDGQCRCCGECSNTARCSGNLQREYKVLLRRWLLRHHPGCHAVGRPWLCQS